MQVNLEQNSSPVSEGGNNIKLGSRGLLWLAGKGRRKETLESSKPQLHFMWEFSCVETCSSCGGRQLIPAEHLCRHEHQPFSGDPRTLCDPVPFLHSSWQREAWPASLYNVVLYSSRGEIITVTGSLSNGTSQHWHTLAGLCLLELIPHAVAQHLQRCSGLVDALCPLENRLPTHASHSMSCYQCGWRAGMGQCCCWCKWCFMSWTWSTCS